jgi:hypothetical protein
VGHNARGEARRNLRRGSGLSRICVSELSKSSRRVTRSASLALLLAVILTLLSPSTSQVAIEEPHVGLGVFLSERSNASLVADMGFDWLVWNLQWSLAEPSKGDYQWYGLDELLASAQSLGL